MRADVAQLRRSRRGAGPALNDLLGGHIDGMFDAMTGMKLAGTGLEGIERHPDRADLETTRLDFVLSDQPSK